MAISGHCLRLDQTNSQTNPSFYFRNSTISILRSIFHRQLVFEILEYIRSQKGRNPNEVELSLWKPNFRSFSVAFGDVFGQK